MATTGILSGTFVMYLDHDATNTDFTIGALGFQYEVIGLYIDANAAQAINLRQTDNTGLLIANGNTVNGTVWIPITATGTNAQIPATVPLYFDVGTGAQIDLITIVCAGRQNITPPTPFTGVEGLTIT